MQPLPRTRRLYSPTDSDVVVDWSMRPADDVTQKIIDDLLAWVSKRPNQTTIRIYLPSVRQRIAMRKLQRSLVCLGCTVTCRSSTIIL